MSNFFTNLKQISIQHCEEERNENIGDDFIEKIKLTTSFLELADLFLENEETEKLLGILQHYFK